MENHPSMLVEAYVCESVRTLKINVESKATVIDHFCVPIFVTSIFAIAWSIVIIYFTYIQIFQESLWNAKCAYICGILTGQGSSIACQVAFNDRIDDARKIFANVCENMEYFFQLPPIVVWDAGNSFLDKQTGNALRI